MAEAERLNQRAVHRALSLDGTCTGEHGIGCGKMLDEAGSPIELGRGAIYGSLTKRSTPARPAECLCLSAKSLNQVISPVSRIRLVPVVVEMWTEYRVPELGMLNERQALQAVSKEAVGIHVLLTRLLFGDGIPHRSLRRVSLRKRTSAPLRFL